MVMNLRDNLEEILEVYGHDVVHVKKDERFRCSCYVERSGSQSYSDCPECFGTGYRTTLHKVRTRRNITSVPETHIGARQDEGGFGTNTPKGYVYYMGHEHAPEEGDAILEVEWQNDQPVDIKEKWMISVSDAKQGRAGRVEFYQVYVRFDLIQGGDVDALTGS